MSNIIALVRRVVRPSVDDCLASFERVQDKLGKARARHISNAVEYREMAEDFISRSESQMGEADRAARVISKIRNLIG